MVVDGDQHGFQCGCGTLQQGLQAACNVTQQIVGNVTQQTLVLAALAALQQQEADHWQLQAPTLVALVLTISMEALCWARCGNTLVLLPQAVRGCVLVVLFAVCRAALP
jgi:hypothetical protein